MLLYLTGWVYHTFITLAEKTLRCGDKGQTDIDTLAKALISFLSLHANLSAEISGVPKLVYLLLTL